jgi:hypothetical protein
MFGKKKKIKDLENVAWEKECKVMELQVVIERLKEELKRKSYKKKSAFIVYNDGSRNPDSVDYHYCIMHSNEEKHYLLDDKIVFVIQDINNVLRTSINEVE